MLNQKLLVSGCENLQLGKLQYSSSKLLILNWRHLDVVSLYNDWITLKLQ